MKSAFSEYKTDLNELIIAYKGIRQSDAFINILHDKVDKEIFINSKLDKLLSSIIRVYPDKYIKDLFLVKLITLLEEYLKNRLIQEFKENENSVKKFLRNYINDRKLTVTDVINGPQKLAISFLDDILFHNLPKVEKVYFLTFNIDVKKLCDFKRLVIIVKMRHLIVHNGSKYNNTGEKVQTYSLQTCLDEINKLIENIEFSLTKGRPKKVVKRVDIDGFDKSIYQENMQDILDHKIIKAFGEKAKL